MNKKVLAKDLIAFGVIFIAVVLLAIMFMRFDQELPYFGDAANYVQMSKKTFSAVENPFALRLLSPYIAHKMMQNLHLGLDASWRIITFTFSFLAIYLFYIFLSKVLKLKYFYSIIFSLFYAFTCYVTMYNFYDFWLVDPIYNVSLILMLIFLFRMNAIGFLLTILLGSVNKEAIVLFLPALPLYMFIKDRKISRKLIGVIIGTAVVAVIYVAYRHFITSRIGGSIEYFPLLGPEGKTNESYFISVIENIRWAFIHDKDLFGIYNTLNFVWVLFTFGFLYYYRNSKSDILIFTAVYFFVACFIGRFIVTDSDRLFVIMAPIVFALLAQYSQEFDSPKNRECFLVVFVVYAAINMGWVKGYEFLVGLIPLGIFQFLFDRSETVDRNMLRKLGKTKIGAKRLSL